MNTPIPPIVFQTSKHPLPASTVQQLRRQCPGWEYRYFSDADIVAFFRDHPLAEFPDVTARFLAIRGGAHRADLFRYYFLYVYGGVFVDSDAMVYVPMNDVVRDYDFVTVRSINPGTLFKGLIGAVPRHPVVHAALRDVYAMDPAVLQANYFILTEHLYQFYQRYATPRDHLYQEYLDKGPVARTVDENGRVLLIHYFRDKRVPDVVGSRLPFLTLWCGTGSLLR